MSASHWRTAVGLTLSSIGIGTYLGDEDDTTDERVVQGITQAVNKGVNVIDTAINYRGQRAERSVGKAVRLCNENGYMRKELFIATKVGFIPSDADRGLRSRDIALEWSRIYDIPPEEFVQEMHCMHPKYLEASLSHSLRNMWLDQVDLLYLHNTAEMQIPVVGRSEYMNRLRMAFEWMEQARQQGNIRWYGMATWSCFTSPANSSEHVELEAVVQLALSVGGNGHGMRFIQLPINAHMPQAYLTQCQTVNGARMTFLEAAETLGIIVLSSRSIGAARSEELRAVQQAFSSCKIPRELTPLDPAAMALQLVRSMRGVTTALVGMKAGHIEQNLQLLAMNTLSNEMVVQCLRALQKPT